jgi:hypothetical protein
VWWGIVAAAITLWPSAGGSRTLSWCIACGEAGLAEWLLNVLLFVPLGVLLRGLGARARRVIATGALLSLCIEALQWLVVAGRTTSVGDLLANTLGTALGVGLLALWPSLRSARGVRGRWVVGAWALCVSALLLFGWWSSLPWLPEGRWYLQREPVRPWSLPLAGQLLQAGIGAHDLPSDRIRDTSLVRAVQSDAQAITARERVGAAQPALSYVLRVVEADGGYELLSLARRESTIVLQRLTNAARWRLGGVAVVHRVSVHDGEVLQWSLRPRGGTVVAQLDAAARRGDAAPEAEGHDADAHDADARDADAHDADAHDADAHGADAHGADAHGADARDADARDATTPLKFAPPSPLRAWSALLPRTLAFTPRQLFVLDGAFVVLLLLPFVWWWRGASAGSRSDAP